ncbi:GroES-like protein [Lepidopterella palustris CBS 459.81]|uniref:GroES-like protein n=1 Tax=Lepidopterella palustris CBS 459.81 TaxID=1314670 RepID=A0A8E2DZE0_9PEZI|nr:GroES-like protein [Lepidopterella palustris CBS 459.81]
MKAIQIKAYKTPYAVSEVPIPKPGPGQVLIKIAAGGFCHTDQMVLDGAFRSPLPYIGSHEPAGTIVEIAGDVAGYKVGDRVGALTASAPCGKCTDCKAGRETYCDGQRKGKGITTDGAWAEYMVSDAYSLIPLPPSLSFPTAAALMCAGITIYSAILRASVPPRGSIAIIGIGGLGHIGTQLAKKMGYTVVAVDVKQDALDLAMSFTHAPDVCVLAGEDIKEVLERLDKVKVDGTEGKGYRGVDATILVSDHPESFKTGAALTRKHGKLVLVGQPAGGITMTFMDLIFRDLTLVGSLMGSVQEAKDLMKVMEGGDVTVHVKQWKPEEAEEMRVEAHEGRSKGKNVVVF